MQLVIAMLRYRYLPCPLPCCTRTERVRRPLSGLIPHRLTVVTTAAAAAKRWVVYEMPTDTDRAVIPADSDWKDTYALGMALDVTNKLSTADSVSEQKNELDAPMPLLFMLTSDARLHMYHFICSEPSMAEASKRVMRESVESTSTTVSYPTVASSKPATHCARDLDTCHHQQQLRSIGQPACSSADERVVVLRSHF